MTYADKNIFFVKLCTSFEYPQQLFITLNEPPVPKQINPVKLMSFDEKADSGLSPENFQDKTHGPLTPSCG